MSDDSQFCTFTVDGLYLGIAVRQVQEVLRSLEMTRVPLAPNAVEGLINLHGQIVTAIDLRLRLGLAPRAPDREPMHVVVRTDDGAVSFMVDDIDDVIEADADSFERAPETMRAETRAFVKGVYKMPKRLLLVLDTTRVVNIELAAAA